MKKIKCIVRKIDRGKGITKLLLDSSYDGFIRQDTRYLVQTVSDFPYIVGDFVLLCLQDNKVLYVIPITEDDYEIGYEILDNYK